MVSALWNACTEGDLNAVIGLLDNAAPGDIEVKVTHTHKDHNGVTPLIQAIQNGHVEIVKALLAKGADPGHPSSQGRPEQYTSDPVMQEILTAAAHNKMQSLPPPPPQESGYPHEHMHDPSQGYYGPPPGGFYYPGPPHMPEGAVPYYPPPPHLTGDQGPNAFGHLPPPDIARQIPCRYFPACRYGATCMFAHPQGQYIPGPMPPAQYPIPYDPMSQYPPHNYYGGSPQAFQSPNAMMSPPSGPTSAPPHHHPMHGRQGSDMMSPGVSHFSPQGPGPIPYGAPMSPSAYPPHSAHVPAMSPLPPPQHPMPPQGPHQMYPPPGPIPPYAGAYPPQMPTDSEMTQKSPPLQPQGDGYMNGQMPREGMSFRRGSMRKPSYGRKPACLFFPSGRCRNGSECRFPHVMPDANGFAPPNRIGPKPRYPLNGVTNLENNIARMNLHDDENAPPTNLSTHSSSRSQSADAQNGFKPNGFTNGAAKKYAQKNQRVPTSDEFPTLGGTVTPPARAHSSNGTNGLTAAQVLQAPAPGRKDSAKDSRGTTPDLSVEPTKEQKPVVEVNGKSHFPSDLPVIDHKIPLSFAAAAATGALDAGKEVSVSA